MDLELKDKVVLVAASSKGLGLGIARQAAREGAVVSMGSRNQDILLAAAESIQNEVPGTRLITHPLDSLPFCLCFLFSNSNSGSLLLIPFSFRDIATAFPE